MAETVVLRLQPVDECGELGVESVAGCGKFLFGLDGHGVGGQAKCERSRILLGKHLFKGEIVFAQQLGNGRLDESGGVACDGRRLAAENAFEQNG